MISSDYYKSLFIEKKKRGLRRLLFDFHVFLSPSLFLMCVSSNGIGSQLKVNHIKYMGFQSGDWVGWLRGEPHNQERGAAIFRDGNESGLNSPDSTLSY